MTKAIIAATALAVLALTPIAATTSAQAQSAPPPTPTTPNYPDHDPKPDPVPSVDRPCTDQLGFLRRVHAGELAAVTDKDDVWVMPICVDDGAFRNAGNVGKLRTAIAANIAMKRALSEKAFAPQEVVGIKMTGPEKVILYVIPLGR